MDFRICNRFTLDLLFFARIRIRGKCHVGNVELRAEQRDSKIQWYSNSSSYFRILIFEHLHRYQAAYCMIFMTDVLNTQVCATRAVCILVPEWSLQWYVIIQETDFCFPESYLILLVQNHKTICPTWATYSLLLSCVWAWLLRSPQ